jgi:hypothetical protein
MGAMEASFWAQPHSTLTSAALITGHHLPILARSRSAERIQRQTIAGGNLQPKVTKSLTRWVVGSLGATTTATFSLATISCGVRFDTMGQTRLPSVMA